MQAGVQTATIGHLAPPVRTPFSPARAGEAASQLDGHAYGTTGSSTVTRICQQTRQEEAHESKIGRGA